MRTSGGGLKILTAKNPPKVRKMPAEGYQSTSVAANEDCRKSFRESDFSILCGCRSKHHQDVLEAMHVLRPKLCKQKSFVTNLVLFNIKHSHKNLLFRVFSVLTRSRVVCTHLYNSITHRKPRISSLVYPRTPASCIIVCKLIY